VTGGDVDGAVEADGVGDPEFLGAIGAVEGNQIADLPAFQIDDAQDLAAFDLVRELAGRRQGGLVD
jgi:hypothetical protein